MSFVKRERFITTLSDLTNERVVEVAPSKSNVAARELFAVLTDEQHARMQAVAMDISAEKESLLYRADSTSSFR